MHSYLLVTLANGGAVNRSEMFTVLTEERYGSLVSQYILYGQSINTYS